MALCPLRVMAVATVAAVGGQGDAQCIEESCQWWDKGVFDVYEAGCGIIPRESRRL